MVGTIEALKQDPKAYPRTPQDADKAELGTAIIRYVLDTEKWNEKAPKVALGCSVEGAFCRHFARLEKKANARRNRAMTCRARPTRDDNGNSPTGSAAPTYKDDPMGGVGGGGGVSSSVMPKPGIGHNGAPPDEPKPDYKVSFNLVKEDSFFYDPRSYEPDFSDARYMGEAKWLDLETAQEMFPDHAEDLASSVEDSSYLSTNPDRETKILRQTAAST